MADSIRPIAWNRNRRHLCVRPDGERRAFRQSGDCHWL